ncbi:MAG TPA: tetratricopeptide repeat protein, partial [Chitinophagaceae bacterium]|nr:tetratricopeptide repeat protein [Chitinophagaceae bacterium]
YQDRNKWNRSLMSKGFELMEESTEPFEVSSYHLEAAIASQHATAKSFEQTDWKTIFHLYEMLYQLQPNPVVAMNKAIASAYAISKQNALNELQQIKGLEHYHIFYASIGEIYFELQNKTEARKFYQRALELTPSVYEQQLLIYKITSCEIVQ